MIERDVAVACSDVLIFNYTYLEQASSCLEREVQCRVTKKEQEDGHGEGLTLCPCVA